MTGETVGLGMPYDSRMSLAPGRAYALRMPGAPTGGRYGRISNARSVRKAPKTLIATFFSLAHDKDQVRPNLGGQQLLDSPVLCRW